MTAEGSENAIKPVSGKDQSGSGRPDSPAEPNVREFASRRSLRREDPRLLSGKGQFTDDIQHPDALHVAFFRAQIAAGRLVGLDTEAARRMKGVHAVLTAQDLKEDGIGPFIGPVKLEGPNGEKYSETPYALLVDKIVRHAGEPLAMVIGESLSVAMDAAEQIEAEFEELEPVITLKAAGTDDAPLIWPERPGNVAFRWASGDKDGVVAALDASHHVTRFSGDVSRVYAAALEPRCALAFPETDQRTVIHVSHQGPLALAGAIQGALNLDPSQVRVIAGDVGGSFGMKSGFKREETLIFWAARRLGKALRWTGTRGEGLMTDDHGRDLHMDVELGLDAEGRFTALKVQMNANIGAFFSVRSLPPVRNFGGISGMYQIPVTAGGVTAWFSNTAPTASYRGAGRPEATFAIERAIDLAAAEMGLDPATVRLRNLVPAEAMPYDTGFLYTYDSGDFPQVMNRALELAAYDTFPARREAAAKRGLLRGIGIANPVEIAAGPLAKPAVDHAELVAQEDGGLTLLVGAMSTGQGLETSLTELAAECLGLSGELVSYVQGDTGRIAQGKGSGGSAGLTLCGSSTVEAADALISKGRHLAARAMDLGVDDITYGEGVFRGVGTNRNMTLAALAEYAEDQGEILNGRGSFQMASPAYPNGCNLCEVEIDPETGATTLIAYTSVEDIGNVLQPKLVEGQIHGGVVQGIGQALMEQISYDDFGQLLSGSFMDYAMPRATDICDIDSECLAVPTLINPLGVKGVGEAGTVGALAATMNAVLNALGPVGVRDLDMPASPGRIWTAINAAKPSARGGVG